MYFLTWSRLVFPWTDTCHEVRTITHSSRRVNKVWTRSILVRLRTSVRYHLHHNVNIAQRLRPWSVTWTHNTLHSTASTLYESLMNRRTTTARLWRCCFSQHLLHSLLKNISQLTLFVLWALRFPTLPKWIDIVRPESLRTFGWQSEIKNSSNFEIRMIHIEPIWLQLYSLKVRPAPLPPSIPTQTFFFRVGLAWNNLLYHSNLTPLYKLVLCITINSIKHHICCIL